MLRNRMLIICLSLIMSNVMAQDDVYDSFSGDDVFVKSRFYFRSFRYNNTWISKGSLYYISIRAQATVGYFYYIGENKIDQMITDGSLESATAIFKKESLSSLNDDSVREIVCGFLFPIMASSSNHLISKDYYSSYRSASLQGSLPKSDFETLQSLIGENADDPITIQSDNEKGRWSAKCFIVTVSGKIETWEFSGVNDKSHFTVDTHNRRVLDIKVARPEITG